jgi:hypothetical protein
LALHRPRDDRLSALVEARELLLDQRDSRFAAICDVAYLVKMRIDGVRDLVEVTPLLAKFRGFMSRL